MDADYIIYENKNKTHLNILFCASGPTMYRIPPFMDYDGLDEMKNELVSEVYDYVSRNDLIFYDNDDEKLEYPGFWMSDIPQEMWKYFIKGIVEHDLDENREYIVQSIKRFYPNVESIYYTTCDPYILDPKGMYGDQNILDIIRKNDFDIFEKTGVKMKFISHHKKKFQTYIRFTKEKYDIIWFLGIPSISYAINTSESYLQNFKNICNDHYHIENENETENETKNGINYLIINSCFGGYTDNSHSKTKTLIQPFPLLDSESYEDTHIKFLLDRLEELEPGVYVFI